MTSGVRFVAKKDCVKTTPAIFVTRRALPATQTQSIGVKKRTLQIRDNSLSSQTKNIGSSVGSVIINLMLRSTVSHKIAGVRFVADKDCVRIIPVRLVTEKVLPAIQEQSIGTTTKTPKTQEQYSNVVVINTTLFVIKDIVQKSLYVKSAVKQ
jgi:hypothetical protein